MNDSHRRRPVRLLALGSLVALLSALVVLPAGPSSAAGTFRIVLTPPSGQTAVNGGDVVRVSGEVPEGELTGARFVGLQPDGRERYQVIGSTTLNRPAPTVEGAPVVDDQADFLRKDGTALSGRLSLSCAQDDVVCPDERGDVRQVLLEVTVAGQTGRSAPLRVDYTRPGVRDAQNLTGARLAYRFTEPVQPPLGRPDNPADFRVTRPDRTVVAVEGPRANDCVGAYGPREDSTAGPTGCTRTLVLDRPVGEDEEPTVEYVLSDERGVPGPPGPYRDFADNVALFSGTAPRFALDTVRPGLPRIDQVEGAAPPSSGRLDARSATPTLTVSNVSRGHTVVVRAVREGAAPLEGPRVTADADQVRVAAPELREDAAYTLEVVVADPRGNLSTETAKSPGRADSGPSRLTYVLDRLAPLLVSASTDGGPRVDVLLSESVRPDAGAPQDWTVTAPDGTDRQVTAVEGTAARRRLTTSAPVPPRSTVTYTGTRYADPAGNLLAQGSLVVGGVALPLVTSPAGPVVTRASVLTVTGAADAGTVVELFRDTNDDGVADGAPVASQQLAADQTAFALEAPLPADGRYDFVVRAREPRDGGTSSPTADVPRITRDTQLPALTLVRPRGGEVLPGDAETEIEFDVQDDHAGPGPVRIEFSPDGGQTFGLVTPGTSDESFTWRTPALSTERALLRLTATDLAGNQTVRESGLFTLDALRPVFAALTQSARTVVVVFSEPVTGSSTQLDWRIEGEPVSGVQERTVDGRREVVLTTGPRTTVDPDELPVVEYVPTTPTQEYRDRAGQTVEPSRLAVVADDGILPLVPSVGSPSGPLLTRERSVTVAGRGQAGDSVELVDASDRVVAGPVRVAPDGTWSLPVALAPDSTTELRARSLDGNRKRSLGATPVPTIEQDASDPVVRVTEPVPGTRLAPGSRVAVRWTSSDRNLLERATTVQVSIDGGRTFTVLGQQQPASGSLTWDVPSTTTSNALVLVTTPDRAGRTGTGTSSPLGIGAEAQAPAGGGGTTASPSTRPTASTSPSASASASPSGAVPSAGPALGIAVSPASITPGQLSTITVSGGTPGAQVELQAYSRPRTEYARVRTGVLGPDGRVAFQVRPGTNTRLFARTPDGSRTSRSAVVSVSTALSLTVVRNGRRDYTFQGRILPRRAGQLITLYRVDARGREIITQQLRTDSTGTYRMRRLFTGSGRFGFLTRTGQTLTNAAGVSNGGRARPTEVF